MTYLSLCAKKGILLAGGGRRSKMLRYRTDRYGMIESFDIVDALRRAELRRAERERRELARKTRAAGRVGLGARLRGLISAPRSQAA